MIWIVLILSQIETGLALGHQWIFMGAQEFSNGVSESLDLFDSACIRVDDTELQDGPVTWRCNNVVTGSNGSGPSVDPSVEEGRQVRVAGEVLVQDFVDVDVVQKAIKSVAVGSEPLRHRQLVESTPETGYSVQGQRPVPKEEPVVPEDCDVLGVGGYLIVVEGSVCSFACSWSVDPQRPLAVPLPDADGHNS